MKNSQFVIYPLSILLDYNVFLHKYFIMLASNSCHDRQFVKREVIEYLEETFGYTLCIHERSETSEWPFLISILKAHTIKCQIYPSEVFYVKNLLPRGVTI